jgi:hypothetical protein
MKTLYISEDIDPNEQLFIFCRVYGFWYTGGLIQKILIAVRLPLMATK